MGYFYTHWSLITTALALGIPFSVASVVPKIKPQVGEQISESDNWNLQIFKKILRIRIPQMWIITKFVITKIITNCSGRRTLRIFTNVLYSQAFLPTFNARETNGWEYELLCEEDCIGWSLDMTPTQMCCPVDAVASGQPGLLPTQCTFSRILGVNYLWGQ